MAELARDQHSDSVKSSKSGCESLWRVGGRERRGRKEGGRERETERKNHEKKRAGIENWFSLMKTSRENGGTVRKCN